MWTVFLTLFIIFFSFFFSLERKAKVIKKLVMVSNPVLFGHILKDNTSFTF
jgi:hypothetical protein